ncbi:MAG: pyrroline-5-carboxylate reductase [Methylotetracoccus sp.]
MKQPNIGFIGAGNMASSLIGGLLANDYPPSRIRVSDSDPGTLASTSQRFDVTGLASNGELVEASQVVILAVKPQGLASVCREIADAVHRTQPLIISIAAGVDETAIDRWLGGTCSIIRCMPNTPALVGAGATALHAGGRATPEHRDWAEMIMRSVGISVWVDREELLDAVTALSGSGPAYFFLLMETMCAAAVKLGLDADTARLLTQQTALGAARIAIESEEAPSALRVRVTSPGGTTERAVAEFERSGFGAAVERAMQAARDRGVELSQQLGKT